MVLSNQYLDDLESNGKGLTTTRTTSKSHTSGHRCGGPNLDVVSQNIQQSAASKRVGICDM